ncbi:putative reverse transcriptase domain-containing protein [Tanacetum coccineum]
MLTTIEGVESRKFYSSLHYWKFKFYAMADLGASVNVIPKSMFEHLKLVNLKKTDMLVEMADMTKRAPIGIKEISLGIGDDRVTFDMDKKIHNFMTHVGKVYMVNSIHNDEPSTGSNAPTDKSP